MWRFADPIRHPIPETRWPTAEEASRSLLFQPIRIGPIELESRTWVPAMVPWRATDDGFVTQDNLDWYGRFAEGRPGAIVVEATGVRDIPSGPLLRIGHDRFIPGLRKLVETVRDASDGRTRLFIQIIDFLSVKRRPEKAKYFDRFLKVEDAPSSSRLQKRRAMKSGLAKMKRQCAHSSKMRRKRCLNTFLTNANWKHIDLVTESVSRTRICRTYVICHACFQHLCRRGNACEAGWIRRR